jgi:hypothetical protein
VEDYLGFIQVDGRRPIKNVLVYEPGASPGSFTRPLQQADGYGKILVVPVRTVDVYVVDAAGKSSLIEEGLKVEAGKLYKLQ